jgi:hypothetical protein
LIRGGGLLERRIKAASATPHFDVHITGDITNQLGAIASPTAPSSRRGTFEAAQFGSLVTSHGSQYPFANFALRH